MTDNDSTGAAKPGRFPDAADFGLKLCRECHGQESLPDCPGCRGAGWTLNGEIAAEEDVLAAFQRVYDARDAFHKNRLSPPPPAATASDARAHLMQTAGASATEQLRQAYEDNDALCRKLEVATTARQQAEAEAAGMREALGELMWAITDTVKTDPMMSGESRVKQCSNIGWNKKVLPALSKADAALAAKGPPAGTGSVAGAEGGGGR